MLEARPSSFTLAIYTLATDKIEHIPDTVKYNSASKGRQASTVTRGRRTGCNLIVCASQRGRQMALMLRIRVKANERIPMLVDDRVDL